MNRQIRDIALLKLAQDYGGVGYFADMLARSGIYSDDSIRSLKDAIDSIKAKTGRNATIEDVAKIISTKAQNAAKATNKTVNATVQPSGVLSGLLGKAKSNMLKFKSPITLGALGLMTGLGAYGLSSN